MLRYFVKNNIIMSSSSFISGGGGGGGGVVVRSIPRPMKTMTVSSSFATTMGNNHNYRNKNNRMSSSSSTTTALASTFKPWKTSSIISNGDYRNEEWIENENTSLYQYQKSLPRLPIPTLEETLSKERFLSSIVPLAKNEDEIQNLINKINDFKNNLGPVLHERLLKRAQEFSNNSSWLQLWWNTLGYLQVRDSNVINVSYFFHFHDDPTIYYSSNNNNHHHNLNVRRAASMIIGLSEFRTLVCSGQLPAEQIGKNKIPLCSTAYKYMFHSTRIPQYKQDYIQLYDPSIYNHAIIIRNGLFYTMDFINPNTKELYSIDILENTIQHIIDIADNNNNNEHLKLGYLTGINRDHWAHARQIMLNNDDIKNSLELLQSGAFVICLDDNIPITNKHIAEMLLHGYAGDEDNTQIQIMKPQGYNRWYDKSIQIIVSNNGKCGLCGEHSMMDGMPVVNLANHLLKENYQQRYNKYNDAQETTTTKSNVQTIFPSSLLQSMKLNTPIYELISNAKIEYDQLVLQNSLELLTFYGYGSTYIKQNGYSPDAFIQMIIQLATYRLFNETQVGTYESTQVRMYLHGRTETTRSVSYDSNKFVKDFGLYPLSYDISNPIIRQEKIQLLHNAILSHVKYINNASKGYGIDRHLFGMSMLVDTNNNESVPELFSDPLYIRSKRWRVSTSHLTHSKFINWGYGQVVEDGVGLSYSIHSNHCVFNITALNNTGYTETLQQLLQDTLLEIQTLLDIEQQYQKLQLNNNNNENSTPRSKL